jgi:hypothetical protein
MPSPYKTKDSWIMGRLPFLMDPFRSYDKIPEKGTYNSSHTMLDPAPWKGHRQQLPHSLWEGLRRCHIWPLCLMPSPYKTKDSWIMGRLPFLMDPFRSYDKIPEKGTYNSSHTMLDPAPWKGHRQQLPHSLWEGSGFVRHLAFLCLMPSPYKTKDS